MHACLLLSVPACGNFLGSQKRSGDQAPVQIIKRTERQGPRWENKGWESCVAQFS
jgi:hypothetical protein